jgi:hypothetical protein
MLGKQIICINLLVKAKGNGAPVSEVQCHGDHGGMEVKPHTFLILALDGCEWSGSHSGHPKRAH